MKLRNEEPKDYWYINGYGDVIRAVYQTDDMTRDSVAIGNHFETPEEAEKVVRKLEAWRRLKEAGFRITGWDNSIGDDYYKPAQIVIRLNNDPDDFDEYDDIEPFKSDLDLLFGGKE